MHVDKVLQVTSKLFRGGAESFIMNVYRTMDPSAVQFDFLVFRSDREYYEDEIEDRGGNVYHVPIMEGANLLRRRQMLDAFFDEHHGYTAVHGHMAALGRDYLSSAARHGIGCRLSHSHVADFERTPRNIVKQAFQRGFGEYATHRLACSNAAGEFMYPGHSFEVVKNGIDVNCFAFDSERRNAFRRRFGFRDTDKVIGHVGRFELVKNHSFLIDSFALLSSIDPSCALVLAGDGSLRRDIEKKAESMGLADRIRFLGLIDDMPSFYDGVDCFVMPSLSEGMPFSAIEAQCSGLPCVLSDGISTEVAITDLVRYQSLQSDAEAWATAIRDALANRWVRRDAYAKRVSDAGFSVVETAARLLELYVGRR